MSSACACARLRGNPSRMKPPCGIRLCASRSRIMPSTMSSSTSVPASIASFALRPSAVPACDGCAQQVAGGDLRNAEPLDETLGLGALARAGRAQQNDAHAFAVRSAATGSRRRATLPAAAAAQVKRPRRPAQGPVVRYSREPIVEPAGDAAHEKDHAQERVLRPVRRRHRRHQCLRLRRHRDGACKIASRSARCTPAATASSARSPRT